MIPRIAVAPGHGSPMKDVVERVVVWLERPEGDLLRELTRQVGFDMERALKRSSNVRFPPNRYAQPLEFLLGYASWMSLCSAGEETDAVAGHSLGEFLAIAIAQSASWVDSLRLVMRCGIVMDAMNRIRPGAMIALLGFAEAEVSDMCAAITADTPGCLDIANLNQPDQIIVSGDRFLVEQLEERSQGTPGRRGLRLSIVGAAHCSIYDDRRPMAAVLDTVKISDPKKDLYLSTTPGRTATAFDVERSIAGILSNRVDWVRTLSEAQRDHPSFEALLLYPDRGMANILRRQISSQSLSIVGGGSLRSS